MTEARRHGRRRPSLGARSVLAVAIVLVLLGGAVAAAATEVDTHHDLQDTRDDLDATKTRLRTTRVSLAGTKKNLARRTTERDSARNDLASARRQLTGVQQSLSDSEHQVDIQAGQIETLRVCLNGIFTALGYAAEGRTDAAIAALESVDQACTDAESLL